MNTDSQTLGSVLRSYECRLCIYGVVTFAVFQLLYFGIQRQGAAVLGAEDGPIEAAQVALAIFGSLALFYAAFRSPVSRAGLVAAGALIAYAAARESDSWFERVFFDDAYRYLVGLPMLAVTAIAIFIDRKKLMRECLGSFQQPAGTLFVIGCIFLGAVCQPLDRPGLWVSISDGAEVMETKAMIEEYAELFAYMLIAMSGIEAVIRARRTAIAARQGFVHDDDGEMDVSAPRIAA
jgi:hypothetical protein